MKRHLKTAKGVFIIIISITFLVCQGIYAAEETLPIPEEIIAKNIEAMGGIKALKKIKNKKIVISFKISSMNTDAKLIIYKERPAKYYSLTDIGNMGKIKGGSDGKMVWNVSPFNGARLDEGNVLGNFLLEDLFDGPDGPDARYKSMKTEGIEQINGKACYKVVKTPEKGTERIVYYDQKSYMIVKTISDHMDTQGKNLHEYYFEYQKIDNIIFPYKEVIFLNGQKVNERTYDKIELNIEMPEGIFDIPEEIKAIMNKNETEQRY